VAYHHAADIVNAAPRFAYLEVAIVAAGL